MAKWVKVSPQSPCPICKRSTWCTLCADGTAVRCMRVESAKKSPGKDGSLGWVHNLGDNPLPAVEVRENRRPNVNWSKRAWQMATHPAAREARIELSGKLGVSLLALEDLWVGVGWDRTGRRFYSFPSKDESGVFTGIQRRYEDGSKKTMWGGTLTLFYGHNWSLFPGPVLIVEGPTDVAAVADAELSVIGRPSRLGRTDKISAMLGDRPALVIGENDRRENDRCGCGECAQCWPGFDGAVMTTRQLARFGADARYMMPPTGIKDVRQWVLKLGVTDLHSAVRRLY